MTIPGMPAASTTTVTFESAALGDAIKKAAKVAPTRAGSAFDKAAGIVLDIFPDGEVQCVVRATDTDVFSAEALTVVEAEGTSVRWRLSAGVLAGVTGALPIANGKTVTFKQDKSQIQIASGRTKATMMLMDPSSYPTWDTIDPVDMSAVSNLGQKLTLVEWAASTDNQPPINGVHLTGESLMATDRYRMVRVPLSIPQLGRPITIPSRILSGIVRQLGDVSLASRGSTLDILVDPYHQVKTIIYDQDYPSLARLMLTDYPHSVELAKEDFIAKVNMASTFAGADRTPTLSVFFGREEVAFMMKNAEVGMLGTVIEVPGQIDHSRTEICLIPKYILDAVSHVPGGMMHLHYDPANKKRPLYISAPGYEAWVMPLAAPKQT